MKLSMHSIYKSKKRRRRRMELEETWKIHLLTMITVTLKVHHWRIHKRDLITLHWKRTEFSSIEEEIRRNEERVVVKGFFFFFSCNSHSLLLFLHTFLFLSNPFIVDFGFSNVSICHFLSHFGKLWPAFILFF